MDSLDDIDGEANRLRKLLDISDELDHIADLDSLLDRILLEARSFSNADAGTIYLLEGDHLRFSYNSQSGRLMSGDPNRNKGIYLNHSIPLDDSSIAGYVAHTGRQNLITDAYELPSSVPYHFNKEFDAQSGYRTVSMLTVPLKTNRGSTVGVMQLVNALDRESGRPCSFEERDLLYVNLFAKNAAVAIERASLTRLIILRMITMAQLRDPKETGPHVNRVAAYSIEIYQHWAETHGVEAEEIKRNKDVLRLSAMMHDVGKIAIPDAILKKPGALSPEERLLMQHHTIIGARLFPEHESRLDSVAAEIALNHHERWDGTGYPGKVGNIFTDPVSMGRGKAREEIPLFGRIVALADVFDALISRRTYKEPWGEDKIISTIRDERGKQFDPEIVDTFFAIYEVIKAIHGRYSD
ncbi:MAG TPA: HD domain-containing phosphohydrolase [Spirochaetia bacterium]|nr:HD domain-containing phosphohydrolase [Spirochaetia bacterium]